MILNSTHLSQIWNDLDPCWKKILAEHLELGDYFEAADIIYAPTITELDLYKTEVIDLWPLRLMPGLKKLDISHTQIQKPAAIAGLKQLEELEANFCSGLDLRVLAALPALQVLDISYPQQPHVHLAALERLTSLKEVYCNCCDLQHLKPFMKLPQLEKLCVQFNPLSREELCRFRRLNPHVEVLF
ncbi:MAG: leucine-rich repeat domain-containing protein [Bacteroidetes bacterium]|nr:MAG: leucine-rich repeat domain-containing protein [Bacteroidota bacterium]